MCAFQNNKAANQRFYSCEPAIKVGDLYSTPKIIHKVPPLLLPLFDLGTPKTIGILLGLCSMILVSYNVLSLTIIP